MYEKVEKPKENQNQLVKHEGSQKQSAGEPAFQFIDNRSGAIAQRKLQEMANNSPQVKQAAQLQAMANNYSARQQQPIPKKDSLEPSRRENKTGLPDNLKTGIENLSGYYMDDVKVHRNSNKPAQLQAHAYAQGTDIHLGPEQEKHIPHEAWHVVQQKQGRVKPTMRLKGKVNINDDSGLEKEADEMGKKIQNLGPMTVQSSSNISSHSNIVQRVLMVNGSLVSRNLIANKRAEFKRDTSGPLREKGYEHISEDQWAQVFAQMDLIAQSEQTFNFHRTSELIALILGGRNATEIMEGMQTQPEVSDLTEVEPWHEDALNNTRQGITEKALKKRQKAAPDARMIDDMLDFMQDKTSLREHLIAVRQDILSGNYLVRRISEAEGGNWSELKNASNPNSAFLKGKESMKAFVVDGQYSFKDKGRDKDKSAYAIILRIRLTPRLKTYFINYLYANTKNMLGSQFTFNPQFKFEQGGVTILIPKAGWAQFMSFVGGNYEILTPKSKDDEKE